MAVRKIHNSWWVDFRSNGIRYRKRSPENSRTGALAYESLLRHKLSKGDSINESINKGNEHPNFKEFSRQWFETYVKSNNKASEIRCKEMTLRVHLIPFFGKTRIDKISNFQIEKYKASKIKTKKLSNKSINNQLTILAKCLRTAEEWLDLNKIPTIKKLKVPPQKYDFLTIEESNLLLNFSKGVWYDLFLLALKTGLRKGELLALTWEDINWKNAQITVRQSIHRNIITSTKSNKIRHIYMTNDVYNCLYKKRRESGFIFTDENGKHFSRWRINDTLAQVCKKAGLRRITCHVLRHTFASHLAMAGATVQSIQQLLGHSDIKTTMRYAHLNQSSLQKTIKLLDCNTDNKYFGQYMVNKKLT
ncbi:tyrosine-type recombinase/integrase [uncultured Desulfosarcina sp.]|uniref:tyrosine-type recombinase/integrase n=1 Tax=uncultured Desulfosarcina sp. TaxID=218289 RepID=UPI0029C88095|nr:tyrosine-type recombinase/integrase [uncultured Desulfosarcina sp.]